MTFLVLGAGFVGKAFCETQAHAQAQSGLGQVWHTHRSAGFFAEEPAPTSAIEFELARESTWKNLRVADSAKNVLWTFAAASNAQEIELCEAFYNAVLRGRNVLVLGSTSAYQSFIPDEKVTEEFPLKLDDPRVQAEENLRQKGASILHLAGLFGGTRDPANWLRRGMIRNGASFVNLIHRDDILRVLAAWFADPLAGERLNLSNGKPRRWNEIVLDLQQRGEIPKEFSLPEHWPAAGSKQICADKICTRLRIDPESLRPFPQLPLFQE